MVYCRHFHNDTQDIDKPKREQQASKTRAVWSKMTYFSLLILSALLASTTGFAPHSVLQKTAQGRDRIRPGPRRPSALQLSASLLSTYTELLVTSPVPTKILTAALLGGGGDAVAQLSEAATKRAQFVFDFKRGGSMIAFGAVYTGAFQAWWINYLLQNVNLDDPIADAALKTGLCQFGTIPLVYMPTFFLITGAVRGMDLHASFANAKDQVPPITRRDICPYAPFIIFSSLLFPLLESE